MILVLEFCMLVGGVILLASGRLQISGRMREGAAIRLAGVVLMLPLPACFLIGFVIGLRAAANRQPLDLAGMQDVIAIVEIAVTLACLFLALAIISAVRPAEQVGREEDDDIYERRHRRLPKEEPLEVLPLEEDVPYGEVVEDLPLEHVRAEPSQPMPSRRQPPLRREPPRQSKSKSGRLAASVVASLLVAISVGFVIWLFFFGPHAPEPTGPAQVTRPQPPPPPFEVGPVPPPRPQLPPRRPPAPEIAQAALQGRFAVEGSACLAVSPDSKILAAAQSKGIGLWDLPSGRPLSTLATTGLPSRLAFTPDGRWLVAGFRHHEIAFYDVATGRQEATLRTQMEVWDFAVTPDGQGLAIMSMAEVKRWDLASGRLRTLIERGKLGGPSLHAVHFLPDGKRLLVAGRNTVWLCDWDSGETREPLPGFSQYRISLSSDGRQVATSDYYQLEASKQLRLYDLDGQRAPTVLQAEAPVGSWAFAPDGRTLALGHGDGGVTFWDLASGKELHRFQAREADERPLPGQQRPSWVENGVHGVWFTPDGRTLLTHTGSGLKAWAVAKLLGRELAAPARAAPPSLPLPASILVRTLPTAPEAAAAIEIDAKPRVLTGPGEVNCVALSPDGRWLASGHGTENTSGRPGSSDWLILWETETGKIVHRFDKVAGPVRCLAFLPDGKRLLVGGGRAGLILNTTSCLKVLDLETGQALRSFDGHKKPVWGVAVLADGRRAASCGADGSIRLWDLQDGKELNRLQDPAWTGVLYCLALTPDEKRVLTGCADKSLRLWDLETGKVLQRLPNYGNNVLGVAVSPDGRRAFSANNWRTLWAWDLDTALKLHEIQGPAGSFITAVALSPDGRYLLSGGSDQLVRVWEAASMKLVRLLKGPTRPIKTLTWSGDGRRIVSGGADGQIRIWQVGEN